MISTFRTLGISAVVFASTLGIGTLKLPLLILIPISLVAASCTYRLLVLRSHAIRTNGLRQYDVRKGF